MTKTNIISRFWLQLGFILFATILLTACSKPETGPVDVKWDRQACKRCQMVLSDRNFSAQIRVYPEGKRSRVHAFDDIGCAVLWLETQSYKNDPKTEIWVNDYHSGKWIDARKSWYIKTKISPMGYGLGAQLDKTDKTLNYAQAVKHIHEVENKFNIHGGNMAH